MERERERGNKERDSRKHPSALKLETDKQEAGTDWIVFCVFHEVCILNGR